MVAESLPEALSDAPPEWLMVGVIAVLAIALVVFAIEAWRVRSASNTCRTAIEAASLPTIAIVRRPYDTAIGLGNLGFSPALDVDCTLTIEPDDEAVDPIETTIAIDYLEAGYFARFEEPPLSDLEAPDGAIYDTFDELTMHVEYDTIGDDETRRTNERTYQIDDLLLSNPHGTEPITEHTPEPVRQRRTPD